MIDTHAHLHSPELTDNMDELITRFTNAGGKYILSCGVDPETNQTELELAANYDCVLPALGLHPEIVIPGTEIYNPAVNYDWIDTNVDELRKIIPKYNSIIAIGECGLDYYWVKRERIPNPTKIFDLQKHLLSGMLKLATEFKLPMVLHCRDENGDKQCEADILDLLVNTAGSSVKGVFHSYTGSLSYLEDILGLGFYVSVNGIVTYKNAENVRKILDTVPNDRLFIETDSHYLVPHKYRSSGIKICEPKFIDEIADFVARKRDISVETLWNFVEANFHKLYQIE
ncbi:MAG: TatD family hydrolase [Patescibacteria group bacterium]|nr:TatD family hydrolase [Patescibacteria group bacterium]